jgi:hypothetical protein
MSPYEDYVAAIAGRFPQLFKHQVPELEIATGPGWDALPIELLEKLDKLLDDEQAALFRVVQIKEKFAGLRMYYAVGERAEKVVDVITPEGVLTMRTPPQTEPSFPRETIDRLIAEAAARAKVTCERCGSPGTLRHGGWMQILCDRCEQTRENDE